MMFKNEEGKVRSGWKIFGMLFITFAIIFSTYAVFNILAITLIEATVEGTSEMRLQKYNELYGVWSGPLLVWQELVMIVVPILIWKKMIKQPLRNMGLDSIKKHTRELGGGLVLGAVSITIVFIVLIVTGNAEVRYWVPSFSIDTIVYLFLFIMVGIAEEILGRGYIMAVLRQTKSVLTIIMVSAVIFSLMHMGNAGFNIIPFINIFLVGVLFAYMYLKSGNIWMPIGYHITWNYFQGNVYGFDVSGLEVQGIITTEFNVHNIINGGVFGPEGGLVVTAIILGGFAFVKWYYKSKNINFLEIETSSAN